MCFLLVREIYPMQSQAWENMTSALIYHQILQFFIKILHWLNSCEPRVNHIIQVSQNQTHYVLQSQRCFWKPWALDDHMFVMHVCSYLATNQREHSQCLTSASRERAFWERLCVCSDSSAKNTCHSSHAPDSVPLNYCTWTVTHPHTHTRTHSAEVCDTWPRCRWSGSESVSCPPFLSPFLQSLLEGPGWLFFIKVPSQQRAVFYLAALLMVNVNSVIYKQHLRRWYRKHVGMSEWERQRNENGHASRNHSWPGTQKVSRNMSQIFATPLALNKKKFSLMIDFVRYAPERNSPVCPVFGHQIWVVVFSWFLASVFLGQIWRRCCGRVGSARVVPAPGRGPTHLEWWQGSGAVPGRSMGSTVEFNLTFLCF